MRFFGLFCSLIKPWHLRAWHTAGLNAYLSPELQEPPCRVPPGLPAPPHMVLEARLVSSCFSFPSRARPRFSRLSLSSGVMVYTLQNVELGETWSLWSGDRSTGFLDRPGQVRGSPHHKPLLSLGTGHRCRFQLNLLMKIDSSEPPDCGGNSGRTAPLPHCP